MFNLFRSRQKATRYLLGGIMLILAASMLTYLTQTGLTTSADNDTVLAEVGPEKVTVAETQAIIDRGVRNNQFPEASVGSMLPTFVDQMLEQKAALYVFGEQGLKVSDEEVLAALMDSYPQFFTNGKLTQKDQLEQQLAAQGLTLADAVDSLRDQLMMRKVQSMIADTVVVTPQEVDADILKKHQKAKITYVAFPPAKFRDQVKATPDEVHKYYEDNKSMYATPEKRAFQAVVIDPLKVAETITVSDAQLHQAYASSMDNFRTPERVKVRHILFMTQGKSDDVKKAQLAKAQGVLKQLRAGADFAEMAKKNSEDPGSAAKGGDLGFIVHGQTVPEFEKTAFNAKLNDISDIITTEYGYHIIQVQEKQAARVIPFEEVKTQIADELKKQGAADKVQKLADDVHAALVKNPASAPEVAKQFGLEVVTAATGRGEAIPNLGVAPEIDGALSTMKPKDVSMPIQLKGDRVVVVVYNELIPSKPADFKDVEAQVREAYVNQMARKLAGEAARTFGEKLRAGGDIEALAKADKLEAVTSEFGMNDSVEGLGQATLVLESFQKPVGTVIGPAPIQGRDIVYKIVGRQTPDVKDYANERDTELAELKKNKARDQFDLVMDSIVAQMRADKKVTIHQDTMKKLAASYAQKQ